MPRAFQTNVELLHIETKPVLIEAQNTMGFVRRYQNAVLRAYNIIKTKAPESDTDAALKAAVKSVKDPVGPDGLVPTLLVYGILPRFGLPSEKPTPSTF